VHVVDIVGHYKKEVTVDMKFQLKTNLHISRGSEFIRTHQQTIAAYTTLWQIII
jgi:hypothetical protein